MVEPTNMSMNGKQSHAVPVDQRKDSPGFVMLGSANGKYWKRDLTNNHFVSTYRRDGIGRRIIRVHVFEMTKKLFTLDDKRQQQIRDDFNFDDVAGNGYLNGAVSGYSLIYVGYPDVKTLEDYENELTGNPEPIYFYVIPRAWVAEDAKENYQDDFKEHYEIYQDSGSAFKIHKSRVIRVSHGEDELSVYETLWNILEVIDNMLWSVGQSMWRAAQGFPVLTVENPRNINDGNGNMKNEVKILQENGSIKNINAMTGFISDARYDFKFAGADGKALKPEQYWKIGMQSLSAATGIPEAKLVGANAGAVTGSEVNEREFASTIKTKQVNELQPIYDSMYARFGIEMKPEDYDWLPIYEQSQEEQATTLKAEMEALKIAVDMNTFTSQQAFDIIKERYPWLGLEAFDETAFQERQQQRQAFVQQQQQQLPPPNPNLNSDHIKSQYDISDTEAQDSLIKASTEPSALPIKSQQVEKRYMRDIAKQYRSTTQVVSNIFQAFESDAEDDDDEQ